MSNFWKGKRVLITGGTGFLGKHLTDALLKQEAVLHVVDFRKPIWDISGVKWVEADIRDRVLMGRLCKDIDIVFHLAAIPSIAKEKFSTYYEVNVKGTQNILEGAHNNKIKKFVHISSSTVYGIPHEFPLRETSPLGPIGKYGKSKLEAENLCRNFIKKGLNISIIRPRVIIGPGRIGIFSILFDRIRNNKPVYIIGKGDNIFQFTNVFDMVSACMKAAEYEKSDLFNIGSEEVSLVKDELISLIKHAKSKTRVISMPASIARGSLRALSLLRISPLVNEQFAIADKNFKLDTEYARQKLNWRPLYSNLDSLIQAYDWYISNVNESLKQYKSIFGVLGRFKHSQMGRFQK